jgi:hypothetical protein
MEKFVPGYKDRLSGRVEALEFFTFIKYKASPMRMRMRCCN